MTKVEAERKLMAMANEHGKFAVQVGYRFEHDEVQQALERCQIEGYVVLLDVDVIAASRGILMRVFMLTDAGKARKKMLAQA